MSLNEAQKRIADAKTRGLTHLDLSDLNLTLLPVDELKAINAQLVGLDIGDNKIDVEGAEIISQNLQNLTELNISNNKIGSEGALIISRNLKNLTKLEIKGNKIMGEGSISIAENLKRLTHLDIRGNEIRYEGAFAISQSLQNLTYLDIGANDLYSDSAKVISQNLKNLINLDLGENGIGDEGALAISQTLKKLTTLIIRDNNIGDNGALALGENLKNLTTLYAGSNNIEDKGLLSICKNLKNLTTLSIWRNNIGDDGATAIAQYLKNLTHLIVDNNNIGDAGVRAIYKAFKSNSSFSASFKENKTQKIPPSAIDSWENLKQYFESISDEKDTINLGALNILLLGNTFSGKSSLQQFYLDGGKNFKEIKKEHRTWGITHKTIESTLIPNLRLSFWDFGGQEYFHGTHRLFIGGRNSLYLVLWEPLYEIINNTENTPSKNENGDDCYPAAYWLGTIRHFEKKKDISERVMVLQSKSDATGNQATTWPLFLNKKQFGLPPENCLRLGVKGASQLGDINSKDYYKALWVIFKTRFEQLITQHKSSYEFNEDMLEIFGDEGLAKWRTENGLSLPKSRFLKLCHKFYDKADDFIMRYMEDSGDILVFKDNPILNDVVFIHPEKLLNSIYDILNKEVKKKGGVFSAKESKDEVLLNVMLEMDLIFENPAKPGEYIAPQFMNENAEISKLLGHLRKLLKIAFSLRFPDFMPRGVITRFIAQKGKVSIDGVFWKYGVMYQYKTPEDHYVKVLVEADENSRFIRVYADDMPGRYDALKEVFNHFTFYEGQDYENKKLTESSDGKNLPELRAGDSGLSIKEPAEYLELSADGQNYASIGEINKAIDHNAAKVRDIAGGYMPLDSIFYVLLNKITTMPKKIFFSYSRHEREYRNEFEVHFATLRRQGLIATWYDGIIEPGLDANAEIMKELQNADIILCLLSPQFMANDYIWNIEMEKAKEAKKTIVPITIKACDYKKYFADYFGEDKQGFLTQKQFDKGQNDGKINERDIIWIASEQHAAKRDEYYNFIVERLKKIIER